MKTMNDSIQETLDGYRNEVLHAEATLEKAEKDRERINEQSFWCCLIDIATTMTTLLPMAPISTLV